MSNFNAAVNKLIEVRRRRDALAHEQRLLLDAEESLTDFLTVNYGPRYASNGAIISGARIVVCGNSALIFGDDYIDIQQVEFAPIQQSSLLPAPQAGWKVNHD